MNLAKATNVDDRLSEVLEKNGGKTGWPPGLLQDDSRGLSKWFATRPDALYTLRNSK